MDAITCDNQCKSSDLWNFKRPVSCEGNVNKEYEKSGTLNLAAFEDQNTGIFKHCYNLKVQNLVSTWMILLL